MKVSVYCLVYNHEKYLEKCLEGFVSQETNFDYEVVVHDDASTDNSVNIIKKYASMYPDIIKPIYQKENQYSKSIPIIETYIFPILDGEYIAVCEGDDYWSDSQKLQIQVDFLEKNIDYAACVHNTESRNVITGETKLMYDSGCDKDLSIADVLKGGNCCFHISSILYRRQFAFNRPEFFDQAKEFGDYPLAIYLASQGKVRFINRVMSVYRIQTESSWTKKMFLNPDLHLRHCESVINMLKSVDKYLNYEYRDLINRIILETKYLMLTIRADYKMMKSMPYREIYLSQPLSSRLKIFIKQYAIPLYIIYKKWYMWRYYKRGERRLGNGRNNDK